MADAKETAAATAGEACSSLSCLGESAKLRQTSNDIQQALEEALVTAQLNDLLIKDADSSTESVRPAKDAHEQQRPLADLSRPTNGLEESREEEKVGKSEREGGVGVVKPRPAPPRPPAEFVDVTAAFSEAASHLAPGQLVQEATFSLFDAMSAIELMDTKMDAAMQWHRFQDYPRTVQEAISKDLLKLEDHSLNELVGIIDEVFACIATWLEGHTLAQTVFTCLYLLASGEIITAVLRAFSQAVIKCVGLMRESICRGGVFAVDDQQGVCFGFDMLNATSDTSVAAALKDSEERLQNRLRRTSPAPSGSKAAAGCKGSVAKHNAEDESQSDMLKALIDRIKFTRSFFVMVTSIAKGKSQGIENALLKLTQALSLVDPILSSLELGAKLDPDEPITLGFHPVINQHLLPPSYKPYGILPRHHGYRVLREVLTQIKGALALGKINSFKELRAAIESYCSAGPKCQNVYPRSLIVLHCVQSERHKLFGSPTIEDLLREDIRQLVNPPSLNSRSPVSTFAKELVDTWLVKAAIPMTEILRTRCQHRARQRQRIVRCLDALGEFQQDFDRLDQQLEGITHSMDPQRSHLGCFTTWLLYHAVGLMIEYIVLGFEYNLYSPFELHYTYWYLEYLYGWYHTTLKSAEKLYLSEPSTPGRGKRKGKRREIPKEREREVTITQAKRFACIGTMRALEALLLDCKIPQPAFEFGGQALCFQHRFLPFSSIATPQLLSHAEYVRLAGIDNYKGKDMNLYEAAAVHFVSARKAFESVHHLGAELEGLLKVVKTNTVIMNLAAKGHKKDSRLPPTMDRSLHRHFPVIRIN